MSRVEPLPTDDDVTLNRRSSTRVHTGPETVPPPPPPPTPPGRSQNAAADAASIGHRHGFDKFRIDGELGRGGMGTVQLAEDLDLRRELAIKILLRSDDREAVDRFVEEAQITGQLQHPNIVPVHEMGVDAIGRPWLAMKRIEGESLATWIHERYEQPLTADLQATILDIFRRVCDGVAFAHDRGVIHRDLKPANIMVGHHGEVLVVDWGLARPIGSSEPVAARAATRVPPPRAASASARQPGVSVSRRESADDLTIPGDIKGTPAYMPPEQARGDTELDERADIFALGGVLYCMLTGENPYTGKNALQVLANAYAHNLPPPRQRRSDRGVPADLDAIVMKAMAAQPRDRYRHVADLVADLQAFETHQPISARRTGLAGRMVKFTRRHPVGVLGTALTLVVVAVVGAVISGLVAMAESAARAAADQRRRADDALQQVREEERQRHEAEVKALVAEGKLEDLARLFDVRIHEEKEDALQRFSKEYEALKIQGVQMDDIFERMRESGHADEYLVAFEKLLTFAEQSDAGTVTPMDRFNYAALLAVAGRHEDALQQFDQVGPDADRSLRVMTLNLRSTTCGDLQRYDEGVECLNEAIGLAPDKFNLRYNRGTLYFKMKRYDEAMADYDRALELQPDHNASFYQRGLIHFALYRHREALADVDRAINLGLTDRATFHLRGMCRLQLRDYPGAEEDFDTALQFNDQHANLLSMRGKARENQGKLAPAFNDYRASLKLDPTQVAALIGISRIQLHHGDVTQALQSAEAALELRRLPAAVLAWAHALAAAGRHAEAVAAYDEAFAGQQPSPGALYARGNCRAKAGDIAGAIADFTAAIETGSAVAEVFVNRGILLDRTGDPDGAMRDAESAIRLQPDLWQAHNFKATLLMRTDRQAALAEFEQALRTCTNPNAKRNIERNIESLRGG